MFHEPRLKDDEKVLNRPYASLKAEGGFIHSSWRMVILWCGHRGARWSIPFDWKLGVVTYEIIIRGFNVWNGKKTKQSVEKTVLDHLGSLFSKRTNTMLKKQSFRWWMRRCCTSNNEDSFHNIFQAKKLALTWSSSFERTHISKSYPKQCCSKKNSHEISCPCRTKLCIRLWRLLIFSSLGLRHWHQQFLKACPRHLRLRGTCPFGWDFTRVLKLATEVPRMGWSHRSTIPTPSRQRFSCWQFGCTTRPSRRRGDRSRLFGKPRCGSWRFLDFSPPIFDDSFDGFAMILLHRTKKISSLLTMGVLPLRIFLCLLVQCR